MAASAQAAVHGRARWLACAILFGAISISMN